MQLKQALKYYGTMEMLGDVLGISRAAVSKWKDEPHNGVIPAHNAMVLHCHSGRKLALVPTDYPNKRRIE